SPTPAPSTGFLYRTQDGHGSLPGARLTKNPSGSSLVKLPFIKPEANARPKPVDHLHHLPQVPFVLLLIRLREAFELWMLRVDQFHRSFKDYCLCGIIGANHASRIFSDIARLA